MWANAASRGTDRAGGDKASPKGCDTASHAPSSATTVCERCGNALTLAALRSRLLFGCCPAAIGRFVIAVVVNAIERATLWSGTHIVKERREVAPLGADRYSACAVTMVEPVKDIRAARVHGSPTCVGAGFFDSARSVTVFRVARGRDFSAKATTTGSIATFQFVAGHDRGISTRATADVCRRLAAAILYGAVTSNNSQAPENIAAMEWL